MWNELYLPDGLATLLEIENSRSDSEEVVEFIRNPKNSRLLIKKITQAKSSDIIRFSLAVTPNSHGAYWLGFHRAQRFQSIVFDGISCSDSKLN